MTLLPLLGGYGSAGSAGSGVAFDFLNPFITFEAAHKITMEEDKAIRFETKHTATIENDKTIEFEDNKKVTL